MYSSAITARNQIRSAIASLVVGWLILLMHTSLSFSPAYTVVAPAGPLWLALRALDRGSYRQALWWAWIGAATCALVAGFWHVASEPGLFCLAALVFASMASVQLRRLAR